MIAIREMIAETTQWRDFHKERGEKGRLEALACNIRLRALQDALAALTTACA